MSTKWTVIISILWIVVVMAVSLAMLFANSEWRYWTESQMKERTSGMANGAVIFLCVTLAPLWIYWGVKRRERLANGRSRPRRR